jgi:putative peptidoglycan lipid II flippase
MVANGTFSLLLMGPLKHGGLALSLSLASTLQFLLLVFILEKRKGIFELKSVLHGALKSLVASFIMALAVLFLHTHWLKDAGAASFLRLAPKLAITILIGGIIYFAMAAFLRCSELSSVREIFRPVAKMLKKKE